MFNTLDPPKSPLERGTLNSEAPFLRGLGDRMQRFKVFQTCVYTVAQSRRRGARVSQSPFLALGEGFRVRAIGKVYIASSLNIRANSLANPIAFRFLLPARQDALEFCPQNLQ